MVKIEVVVRPEEAAMVWSAMEAAGKDVSAEGFDRVDGLMALAQARLRGDRQERSPVEVVVTMDRAALSREAEATDVGVLADGTCGRVAPGVSTRGSHRSGRAGLPHPALQPKDFAASA